jgi:competence protein ComEC
VAPLASIPLLAGCACGLAIEHPPSLTTVVLAVAIVCTASSVVAKKPCPVVVAIAAGFFGGGVRLAAVAWDQAWRTPLRSQFEQLAREARQEAQQHGIRLPLDDEVGATVVGVLVSDAAPGANGVSMAVEVTEGLEGREGPEERRESRRGKRGEARPEGRVLLTVAGSIASERIGEWRSGRRVRLPAVLRRPARYLDPGVPDAERTLARRGVTLVGTVKSGALVDVVARGSRISEALAAARAFSRRAIEASVSRWSRQSGAIVAAIVIGDRSTLDDRIETRLQEAGTYHVIAISGGNIAILAGLLLVGFRFAGRSGRGAAAAAIVVLAIYDAFVGGGASVDRATLMAILYFTARLFDHRTPPLNALAVAGALLALVDPLSVVDPGFLLTFGATLAILLIVPWWDGSRLPAAARLPASMLCASLAAELMLLPIGVVLFSRVTIAGLALNFVAIPLMAVAQVAGMVVVPLALIPGPMAQTVGWIAHAGAAGLIASADLVRFAPMVTWRVAPSPPLVIAIYYASFLTALTVRAQLRRAGSRAPGKWRHVNRFCVVTAAVAGLWIVTDPRTLFAASGDGHLHATFLDVGQGDAAFIVFPGGSTLLVDAGGLGFSSSFDIGERVVAPVVRALGFRRIDRVAVTHGDPDHLGGALAIVREFRPREVWEGIPVPRSAALTALREETRTVGGRWANVHAGDRIAIDGVEVVALHPEREEWERQKVRNDDSLVLELRWRDVSMILSGDVGRTPEQRIAPLIAPARIRLVKVPHHGSLTSSSAPFVAALKPTIAIVSVGRSNHYGHPVPEVLERYSSSGAETYRTDRDGAVMFDTDGYSFHVTGHSSRH